MVFIAAEWIGAFYPFQAAQNKGAYLASLELTAPFSFCAFDLSAQTEWLEIEGIQQGADTVASHINIALFSSALTHLLVVVPMDILETIE